MIMLVSMRAPSEGSEVEEYSDKRQNSIDGVHFEE